MAKDKYCKGCGAALVWEPWEPDCVCEFCGANAHDHFLSLLCEVTSALGLDESNSYDLSKAQSLTEQLATLNPTHCAVYAMVIIRLTETAYGEDYVENGQTKNQLLFEAAQAFLKTQEGKSDPEYTINLEEWTLDTLAHLPEIMHMAIAACDCTLVQYLLKYEADPKERCSLSGEAPIDALERLANLENENPSKRAQYSAIHALLAPYTLSPLEQNRQVSTAQIPRPTQSKCSITLIRKSKVPIFPIKAYFDGIQVGELKANQSILIDTETGVHCVEGRYLLQHGIDRINITGNTTIKIDFNALGLLKVSVL